MRGLKGEGREDSPAAFRSTDLQLAWAQSYDTLTGT
jgi:hypothetical protein